MILFVVMFMFIGACLWLVPDGIFVNKYADILQSVGNLFGVIFFFGSMYFLYFEIREINFLWARIFSGVGVIWGTFSSARFFMKKIFPDKLS